MAEQVRLIVKELYGDPLDTKKIRSRRLQGGNYELYEVTVEGGIIYAVDVYCAGASHAAFIATNEQIEEIFGFEALPDRSSKEST